MEFSAMKLSRSAMSRFVVIALAAGTFTGCGSMNNTQKGAGLGAGLGALTGAIIGHQTGNRDKGALIGAALGGVGGGLLGNTQDKAEERDAALAHAHHSEMARRADQMAVTNRDVVNMSQNGISDQLIISTMQNRGGKFDTSPHAIIALREHQVSEGVIQAMNRYNSIRL